MIPLQQGCRDPGCVSVSAMQVQDFVGMTEAGASSAEMVAGCTAAHHSWDWTRLFLCSRQGNMPASTFVSGTLASVDHVARQGHVCVCDREGKCFPEMTPLLSMSDVLVSMGTRIVAQW